MKVMGVDPGLANTGLAVVNTDQGRIREYFFGMVRTQPKMPTTERLWKIYDEVRQAVDQHQPDLMVLEDIFTLGRYPKSAILLGKATGAILVAGRQSGAPVIEVAVREAKKVLTGNGAATKEQLELAVRRRLGRAEPIRPSHVSDALALALVGVFRMDRGVV